MVPNTVPAPHSSMRARPTLSVALALTLMLLPVPQAPAGDVIVAVGGVVSPLVDPPPEVVVPPLPVVPPPLPLPAPDATSGEVASLLIVIGDDTVLLPALSYATALT